VQGVQDALLPRSKAVGTDHLKRRATMFLVLVKTDAAGVQRCLPRFSTVSLRLPSGEPSHDQGGHEDARA
jgi:hypothetical protein